MKIFAIAVALILIITPMVWYSLKLYLQKRTQEIYNQAFESFEKRYAYTNARGVLDQTLYTENETEGRELVRYYRQLMDYYKRVRSNEIEIKKSYFPLTGDSVYDEPVTVPVPIRYLSVPQQVFVKKGTKADSLTEVFVFNTKCWGYFRAFVPSFNLHPSLPSDSILKNYKKSINSLPKKKDDIYGRPSPFGFYCN